MGFIKVSTPLLFQSKLLCLSLFYLLTTLPLSIYVSLSQTGCLFQAPPTIPTTDALFSYPKSYGEHKYALPASSHSPSCNSPLLFSDYKLAFQEIHDTCTNSTSSSSSSSSSLRYLGGTGESFAGNYSFDKRKPFFNYSEGAEKKAIPCGFLRQFPVKDSDRLAMDKCRGVVVASAIFGDHDKVRQPRGLGSKTLQTVCFFMFIDELTIRGLKVHNILADKDREEEMIGAWRVVRVQSGKLPYENLAMNGVIPKYLVHRLFPNSKFSIWVDAKLELTVDPLLLIHSLVISKDVDMAISKHPFNVQTMEEAMATARWKKWGDVESLRVQMETYCENGLQPWSPSKLPYPTDVPDTALILRRHGLRNDLFSCLLFNELEAFNPRDQLAFAYVRDSMNPKIKLNMFEVEVFEQVAVEYRHNLKPMRDGGAASQQKTRRASSRAVKGSACEDYLMKMWGESTDWDK